jgi:hypothetical protein
MLCEDTHRRITLEAETKHFYEELNALQEIMAGYEKWVNTAEKVAEEATEIGKQLEQCKVSTSCYHIITRQRNLFGLLLEV